MADLAPDLISGEPGLRDRKKAKRRDEIIVAARELFARQGIDATTMADIAAACGVSAPTVFNYFGSKDGILIALISEGTSEAREGDRDLHWQPGRDLGSLVLALFLRVSERTLALASKRVWRYAEAATIRRPDTDFSRQYIAVSQALIDVVAEFFAGMDLRTHSGAAADPAWMAQLFHDVWTPCFIRLIADENQTLAEHEAMLRAKIMPLVALFFDPSSVQFPLRKGPAQ
jgi:AcrR family transcriptional regulator